VYLTKFVEDSLMADMWERIARHACYLW